MMCTVKSCITKYVNFLSKAEVVCFDFTVTLKMQKLIETQGNLVHGFGS